MRNGQSVRTVTWIRNRLHIIRAGYARLAATGVAGVGAAYRTSKNDLAAPIIILGSGKHSDGPSLLEGRTPLRLRKVLREAPPWKEA